MWQLRKKLLRLTERLHFGELNQLNGCGRAEREAGCVHRAEELSGKRLSFSCQDWIFYLSFRFIGAALTRRSLFLIFQSRFSLLSVLLSLASPLFLLYSFFFPLVKSLLALLLTLWLIASFFLKHSMADRQTDTQPVRVRWDKAGHDLGDTFRCPAVKAEAISWAYE